MYQTSDNIFKVYHLCVAFFWYLAARNLRETKDGAEKSQSGLFKPNHEETKTQENNGDLVDTMDYTPAKKNPPIHN